jgi:hypothetical protein
MPANRKLNERLSATLVPGESVVLTVVAQLKGGAKKRLAKNMIRGAATTLVTTVATGGAAGFSVVKLPPAVWVVVTSERLLLIARTNAGLGETVFDAPLGALTGTLKSRLLNEVTIADAEDGVSLLRLNLGVKKRPATRIVAATGNRPGRTPTYSA